MHKKIMDFVFNRENDFVTTHVFYANTSILLHSIQHQIQVLVIFCHEVYDSFLEEILQGILRQYFPFSKLNDSMQFF